MSEFITVAELRIEAERLCDENDALRELVQDMFRDFANADYELKRHHGKTFMAVTRYKPRLQELGIEVLANEVQL